MLEDRMPIVHLPLVKRIVDETVELCRRSDRIHFRRGRHYDEGSHARPTGLVQVTTDIESNRLLVPPTAP